ncbi:MAG: hypothetical protein IRY94_18925, partial [Rhodospirillaceae bacterium]|nr:hypothetical protein [Rhodospirillaceae bacterium]
PYDIARLVLDTIRALVWPAVILFLLVSYRSEIATTLTSSDIEVAGFKLTRRVETLTSNLDIEVPGIIAELDAAIRPQLPADGAARLQEIERRIAALARNVGQDLAALPAAVAPTPAAAAPAAPAAEPAAPAPPPGAVAPTQALSRATQAVPAEASTVQGWEAAGFRALLLRDAGKAAAAFARAYALWPDYHNVDELHRLLEDRKAALAPDAEAAWVQLYRLVLDRYSWGMPADVREAMRRQAG